MRQLLENLDGIQFHSKTGRVVQYLGLTIEATGPDSKLGEICNVYPSKNGKPIRSEVVGFKNGNILLMPYGKVRGISLDSVVVSTGKNASVKVSDSLLGRVVDAFGKPLDGGNDIKSSIEYPLYREPRNPMQRESIQQQLESGIKAVDAFIPFGAGQRTGIFAGSGVGKSSLLGMFARNLNCDINVIVLVGERGREVKDFVDTVLGSKGMKNSVVVVATSDQPALVRTHSVFSAIAIAEFFSEQGKNVVLTIDSITRFAMAQREIGLAVGEPVTSKGYTPSVFSSLSPIVERAGNFANEGSISALITVLVEGDDLNDPIADYMRGILDGHIVLSREMSNSGRYPAIDLLTSKSRLCNELQSDVEAKVVSSCLRCLHRYEQSKDMIEIGVYESGSSEKLDEAIKIHDEVAKICEQKMDSRVEKKTVFSKLEKLSRGLNASPR